MPEFFFSHRSLRSLTGLITQDTLVHSLNVQLYQSLMLAHVTNASTNLTLSILVGMYKPNRKGRKQDGSTESQLGPSRHGIVGGKFPGMSTIRTPVVTGSSRRRRDLVLLRPFTMRIIAQNLRASGMVEHLAGCASA